MDHTHNRHDAPARGTDGDMVYAGRFGDAELTEDDRDTLQAAFAALVRAGRPLFSPEPEEGAGALIDPADPGLNTRVAAILDPSTGPWLRRRDNVGTPDPDVEAGDSLAVLDELERLDPALDSREIDDFMAAGDEGEHLP